MVKEVAKLEFVDVGFTVKTEEVRYDVFVGSCVAPVLILCRKLILECLGRALCFLSSGEALDQQTSRYTTDKSKRI